MKRFPRPETIAMLKEKGLGEREIAAELFDGDLLLTKEVLEELDGIGTVFRSIEYPLQASDRGEKDSSCLGGVTED